MQFTPRASVLAVALLASSPLLAAGSGTVTTGADVSTQEATTRAEQDDCWLPTRPSTDLPDNPAGFLTGPGGSPDSAGVDRDLSATASCLSPLSLGNDDPADGVSHKRGDAETATPARTEMPDLGTVFFWKAYLMQTILLKPGTHL